MEMPTQAGLTSCLVTQCLKNDMSDTRWLSQLQAHSGEVGPELIQILMKNEHMLSFSK